MMLRLDRKLLALTLLSLVLGCGDVEMKPGERARNNRDLPQGPGLFTGSEGQFILYRSESTAEEVKGESGDAQQSDTVDGRE